MIFWKLMINKDIYTNFITSKFAASHNEKPRQSTTTMIISLYTTVTVTKGFFGIDLYSKLTDTHINYVHTYNHVIHML